MGKESETFRAALDADEIKRGSWGWYPGLKDWVPIESFRDVEPLISESNCCSNPWYLPHHGFSAESFGAIEDAEAPGPDDWSVFDGPFFGARRVLKGESFRWVVDKENEGYCWWVAVRPYESDDSSSAARVGFVGAPTRLCKIYVISVSVIRFCFLLFRISARFCRNFLALEFREL